MPFVNPHTQTFSWAAFFGRLFFYLLLSAYALVFVMLSYI